MQIATNTYACVECGKPATGGENFAMCDVHALEIDHWNWSFRGDPWPLLNPEHGTAEDANAPF
jgi:hypothetical protein